MEEKDIKKSSVSFLTKKEFNEQRGNEFFSVEPQVEEKLKSFSDDDLMALEVAVNSPAKVVAVHKIDSVVDFMNERFVKEGITKEQINAAFKFT